jgi:ethanolamine utilization cobalamin adenosyltransferase
MGQGEGALPKDSQIILTQTLITTATLEHKLQGVARLSVPAQAVVTPSAHDLLKERNIELVRTM